MASDFYWRHARDSILTRTALRMFQLVAAHEGEVFNDVKDAIDQEYRVATGSSAASRHGGIVQTQIRAFREAGWVTLKAEAAGETIEVTPAGKQALLLLTKLPDFLKAAPFFIVELLARYQLNNPSGPGSKKNAEYEAALKEATVFPYWTLLKLIRTLEWLDAGELRRFVLKIRRHEDVEGTIESIRKYRAALQQGLPEEKLDEQFGKELEGAISEPKYLMGRLGTQVGHSPALVEKEGASRWRLNPHYYSFVDEVLANEPVFRDYLTEETWMTDYGEVVPLDDDARPKTELEAELEPLPTDLPDSDPVFQEVLTLIETGSRAVLLSGPPGTSKTWYARKIAGRLVEGDARKARFMQFHPSMGYDDFVEGYVPQVVDKSASFSVVDKIFLKLCAIAERHKPDLCVLVIDEINRGDLGRILGELLTYIEPDYRERSFQLAYSGRTVSIPSNLLILGTFNPFDKSVVELDDAIDRRFDRISLEPSPKLLHELLLASGADAQLTERLVKFFVDANKLTRHGLGHALFFGVKDEASLRRLWNRKLCFIFEKAFRFEPEALEQVKAGYTAVFASPADAGT